LAILLLGILWRRATGIGALAGLILGVGLTTSMFAVSDEVFIADDPFLFISFWSFLFTLVITVVVSLFTRAEPTEKLRGLVYGEVMKDPASQDLLKQRVNDA
jgi:Na+/proline symporter